MLAKNLSEKKMEPNFLRYHLSMQFKGTTETDECGCTRIKLKIPVQITIFGHNLRGDLFQSFSRIILISLTKFGRINSPPPLKKNSSPTTMFRGSCLLHY